jgi:phage terminase small subunit
VLDSIDMKQLTAKQQLFVAEYLVDMDGAKAVRRAGYKVTSDGSAASMAHDLLDHNAIKTAIAAAMKARTERTAINADWVLRRLVDEADADLADLYDYDNNLRPIKDWPLVWRRGLVTGVEVEELFEGRGEDREQIGLVRKVRLSERIKRTELIGKHVDIQAFRERHEHTGKNGGPIESVTRIERTIVRPGASENASHTDS